MSLRQLLIVLVLVPLLGLMASTFIQLRSHLRSVTTADRVHAHVDAMVAYVRVRSAFNAEVGPAEIATSLKYPSLTKGLVLSGPERTNEKTFVATLPAMREHTDVAVAHLGSVTGGNQRQASIADAITEARRELDQPETLFIAEASSQAVLTQLAGYTDEELAATGANGLGASAALSVALQQVALVAEATNAAMQELALFGTAEFYRDSATAATARTAFLQGWAAFEGTSAAVPLRTSAPIAAQWKVASNLPAVAWFEHMLAAEALSPGPLLLQRAAQISAADSVRSQAYLGVLSTALDTAVAQARGQRQHAINGVIEASAAAAAITLISLLIAALVARAATRPLDELARTAKRISEGNLTDVSVAGPREVRTVARALEGSVATLRKIEAQAAAVSAGDLTSPVVRQALPGPLGKVVQESISRIIKAIQDREVAQRELAHRASHDALTELPNRAQALALIEQALHRAQRSGTKTALMFIDLDDFKAVNDNFGHAAGDGVLRTAAARMLASVREGDSVARLGGDEFVILLENVDDEADVLRLAERVIDQLSQPTEIDEQLVKIGASIGVAVCRDGYVDAGRLLKEADAAVYKAKSAGRGRADVFDDVLRSDLAARATTERAIAVALGNDEFVLYYQPVVDLQSGATVGMEALIRWQRPGFGLLLPSDFIPVAEQSTLVNDVGRWVLREAARQLAAWDTENEGLQGLTMAVNISGRHLAGNRLLLDVESALADSGILPSRLILELTETVLVDFPLAIHNLHALRQLGVQISIDDFGTGYTSIGQLPRLPVDSLKIDRSFVASADPAHQELVRLTVGAAHAFGLTVVAEGIETDAQANTLLAVGAEFGQGYLYGRPTPAAQINRESIENVRRRTA